MTARLLIAFALQCSFLAATLAGDPPPYVGDWSNGRGETLAITSRTIQFGDDKPVPYRDVTRATDGSIFELQITAAGKVNAFDGKTLAVSLEDDSMEMTGYLSHADYMEEKNPQQVVTWTKDAPRNSGD
jgi:hypothetical protein